MKLLSLAGAAAAVTLIAVPALADLGPLVTPAELAEALDGEAPLVLDIRAPDAQAGGSADATFGAGHIPGAVNAPYAAFRGPASNPGALPSDEALGELLSNLGVSAERPVVVVHQGSDASDFGAAARVYWTLKSSGLTDLSILNGGVIAWKEAGLPLSTEAVTPEPSNIEITFSDQWLATAEDIKAVVDGEDQALLLDARPEAFWKGESSHAAMSRPGTLPQSRYFEHSGWFGAGAATIDPASVQVLAEAEGFTEADQLVSFCNTGHWAATNWFALSELAGVENVKLYPESMVGWSNAGYEMANVPGPVRNLWIQIKNAF